MDNILQQIFDLLTTPPGNLIYHLVLGFAVIAALQAVLMARHSTQSPNSSRIILGLTIIVLSQVGNLYSHGPGLARLCRLACGSSTTRSGCNLLRFTAHHLVMELPTALPFLGHSYSLDFSCRYHCVPVYIGKLEFSSRRHEIQRHPL